MTPARHHDLSYIAFCSGGNDSVALIQYLYHHAKLKRVDVVYNNTGWAATWWAERIKRVAQWVESLGYQFTELSSEGMESLVKRKKGWPAPQHGMQFCTEELKIAPSLAYLDNIDPERSVVCCVGVRREESVQRRQFPEWTEESKKHGYRSLWGPLVRHTEEERNLLLAMTPFYPLPHRSCECSPCIYANRSDIRELPEEKLVTIERIEKELGFTKNGKPRTLFRPHRQMGAVGIREAVKWAHSEKGKYEPPRQCDSGYCGN